MSCAPVLGGVESLCPGWLPLIGICCTSRPAGLAGAGLTVHRRKVRTAPILERSFTAIRPSVLSYQPCQEEESVHWRHLTMLIRSTVVVYYKYTA